MHANICIASHFSKFYAHTNKQHTLTKRHVAYIPVNAHTGTFVHVYMQTHACTHTDCDILRNLNQTNYPF